MTYEQIIKDLKNKIYKPVYFLMGEEAYYIDLITDYIAEHVLTEDEKSFNQTIMYGKECDARTVDIAARRFPMMANHQVIIVKEAQEMKGIDELIHYCEKPQKTTLLVLNYKYKSYDKRKAILKTIDKTGVLFESKKLYDNQLPDWITSYLKPHNYNIKPDAATLLSEFLGTELSKVANELNKLMILLPPNTIITADHIEKNIGVSKDYNVFELQKALGSRDILKVYRIINYFGQNQKDNNIIYVISQLYGYFTKILLMYYQKDTSPQAMAAALGVNPYFLRDYQSAQRNYNLQKLVNIVSVLREYDLKAKGVDNSTTDASDLLREMIFKILH